MRMERVLTQKKLQMVWDAAGGLMPAGKEG